MRWPFNLKYKADGTIEQYKACHFAKGYTQTHGTDYVEMLAPTKGKAKYNSSSPISGSKLGSPTT